MLEIRKVNNFSQKFFFSTKLFLGLEKVACADSPSSPYLEVCAPVCVYGYDILQIQGQNGQGSWMLCWAIE